MQPYYCIGCRRARALVRRLSGYVGDGCICMRRPIEGRAREGLGLVGTVLALTLRLFLVCFYSAFNQRNHSFFQPFFFFLLPSFISFDNRSTDVLMQQGKRSQDVKSSFDVTDDLEHATALSYTSHIPLNDRNAARSTTSLNPQHGDDPSQTQVDREDGDPQQVYFDSHSQNQRPQHPRGSSWDLLGGARKINEAYEQFDSRNASEQHLVFADGDLPNSKVSHRLLFLVHMALKTDGGRMVISLSASTNFS